MSALANHLWQSTAFALAVAALAWALRGYRARVRYGLWLSASLKFFIPLAWLTKLGERISWQPAPSVENAAAALGLAMEPFEPVAMLPMVAPAPRDGNWLPLLLVWAAVSAALFALWAWRWRAMRRLAQAATLLEFDAPIPVRVTGAAIEPGVFGIVRPVLLLPAGILARLSGSQFRAILAHELCHVARRDNLAAALHMAVERIFWFHPLVWWIGRRLITERENACDEQVLREGNDPGEYAQGIVNVCRFSLPSPMPCVSGVTGADLKGRIRRILTAAPASELRWQQKVLLAAAAVAVAWLPLTTGALRGVAAAAQTAETKASAPRFEVAVIKPSDPAARNSRLNRGPGGALTVGNLPVASLISFAYDVREFQIEGGPAWMKSARFDIQAKPDRPGPADPSTMTDAERMSDMETMRLRIRSLLAERFQLTLHRASKELPVYALVVGKGGSKLTAAKGGEFSNQHMSMGRGQLTATRVTIAMLVQSLSQLLGRPVQDQTGLTGDFDFKLEWTPDLNPAPADGEPAAPSSNSGSLFAAIQEQLGLKLESKRAPADIVVIDKLEKPSEN